jgi:hypothetical protein
VRSASAIRNANTTKSAKTWVQQHPRDAGEEQNARPSAVPAAAPTAAQDRIVAQQREPQRAEQEGVWPRLCREVESLGVLDQQQRPEGPKPGRDPAREEDEEADNGEGEAQDGGQVPGQLMRAEGERAGADQEDFKRRVQVQRLRPTEGLAPGWHRGDADGGDLVEPERDRCSAHHAEEQREPAYEEQ